MIRTIFSLLVLILASQAQAQTFSFEKLKDTYLTPEAEKALITYVKNNCHQVEHLKENSTSKYIASPLAEKSSYQLATYIDFEFTGLPGFDRVEIIINENKASTDAEWTAQVAGFSSGSGRCSNL
jgi:hypothetical protein